jgi:uncharacterized protein YggT (Ycf19 family)
MRYSIPQVLTGAINLVSGIIVTALGIRLLLRLFGANPDAGFVEFMYDSTGVLLHPFRNIFEPYVVEPGNVLEFSTLVAIVIYLFIGWLLVETVVFIDSSSRKRR